MLTNPNWKLIHHKSRFKVALVNENQWSQLIFMYETNDGAYLEKNCKTIQLILHHKNSKQNDACARKKILLPHSLTNHQKYYPAKFFH